MLNVILLTLALTFNADGVKTTYTADVDQSNVVWVCNKIVSGGEKGTIKIKEGFLELDDDVLTGGSFVIDMTSITSTDLEGEWKAKLEGHLKSDDFFSVATYKTATLKITGVKSTGDGKYDISADVTIKGKTEAVNFSADVTLQGDKVTATAKLILNRAKFDVRYGSNSFFDNLGDKAISDEFTLDVNLVTTK